MIKTFRGWSDGAASICFIPSRRFRVSRPAHRKAACPGENRMTRDSGIFSAKKRKKSGPAKKNRENACTIQKSAVPLQRKTKNDDSVAQLVEQLTLNQRVESSSLSGVTRQNIKMQKTSEIQPISEVFRFPHPAFRRKILKLRGGRKGYTADRGVDCTLARVLIAIVQRFTPIPNL